jgi:hypothetical protein
VTRRLDCGRCPDHQLNGRVGPQGVSAGSDIKPSEACYKLPVPTPTFVAELLGFRESKAGKPTTLPNIADSASATSVKISHAIMGKLGAARLVPYVENSGALFEERMRSYILAELTRLEPTKEWTVDRRILANFEQYAHLARLQALINADESRVLAVEIGSDYVIAPDVTVGLPGIRDPNRPTLHAAVSCKWTLRSDRAQNVRHEAVMMIRHRRGRLPHIVAVTMEPLPSRIAALATGTGEVDMVFHPVFDELGEAVQGVGSSKQKSALAEMVSQDRLFPLQDLPAILVGT